MMPLNKLTATETNIPKHEGIESIVDNALKFDKKFRKAFLQCFGRTAICKSLELASNFVGSQKLNFITLEGDRIDSKGALTGNLFFIDFILIFFKFFFFLNI